MESSSPSTAADSVKSIKNKGIALQKMKHAPLKTKKLVGKISSSKPKKALSEKNRISLNRIKDWIVGILVKYYGESSPAEESTEIEEEQKQEPAASKIEEKEKAPYGVMSIVEARARRRAERKAALLKKKIRRRLDSDER
jgi:hypothetical protein